MDHHDVVVVGGGLSGLATATLAARAGARVALLERKSTPGGRATTDVIDGFAFNQGAHALYKAGRAMAVLRGLGIEPTGGTPPLSGRAHRDGRLGRLAAGPASLPFADVLPVPGRLDLGRALTKVRLARAEKLDGVSLQGWVESLTRRDDTRDVVLAIARLSTYVNGPELVSAGAVARQIQQALHGVLYLHGGWQQLVDALAATADTAGVQIVHGATVHTVSAEGTDWVAATAEREWPATAVVLAGLPPAVATRILDLSGGALCETGPKAQAAVLDLSLDTEPDERFVLGIDKPTYFSVHGPPASMAPEGKAAAVAMKYLPIGAETTLDEDCADLEEVARLAGATAIVDWRVLRRMTVAHGIPLASAGGLAGRPAVAVAERPGVFLAGDWVGPEGLLADAALASADRAAAAALSHAALIGAGSL